MAGDRPDVRFVHQLVQQAEHHGVARVRPQERRIRVSVDRAAEQLRGIRIVRQALRKRFRAEVEAAAGRMRAAVDVLVRRVHDLLWHLERNGLSSFQGHFHRLSGRIAGFDDVDRMRHRVVDGDHQLTEAAADAVPDRLVGMNVRDRTAPHQLAVLRIVIGGPERLHDRHAEPAVRPGRRTERVVVPEHGAHIHVHPPPIADELRRDQVVRRVVVLQRLEERDRIALDLLDAGDLGAALVPRQRGRGIVALLQTIHTDHQLGVDVERRGAGSHLNLDAGGSGLGAADDLGDHRSRQPVLRLLAPHRERPDRHFIFESGDHAVRVPCVELEEVGMDVDLRRLEVRVVVVVPFARQHQIHAVVDVGADDRRELEIVVGPGQTLLLMEQVDQAVLVHDGRLFPLLLGQGDRHADEVNVVELLIGVLRAETPASLLARLGRLGGPFTVGILVDRLQPGRAVVVRGERHPLAEVRLEQRPRHPARGRVEKNGGPGAVVPLGGGGILRILRGALALADGDVAVPLPVPHGGVVGHDLAFLVFRMARFTGGRHPHLDPVLDVHDGRIGFPVGLLALVDDLELLAEPIDGRADQLVGRHAELHAALPVRQFRQVRHRVGMTRADLQRIVEPAVAPHARHVMVGDVAMVEELARQMLAAAAAALRLEVERLGGTDDFHVHTVGLRPDDRILHRTVLTHRPEVVRFGPRAPLPADGPAVRMVGVKYLGSAVNQPPLDRIAQIPAGDRRRNVAEGVGAVGQGLVLEPEILMLQVHLVDAEGLAAIVDRAAARAVGVGQRIALRQEVALLVQRTEGFVADFVIEQHEFAEVRSGPVVDVDLPARLDFLVGAAADRIDVLGSLRLHDEGAEEAQHRQLAVMAVGVELPHAFLHVRMDVPLELLRLAGRHDGIRIRRRGRFAGRAHDRAGGLDEQAAVFRFHLVPERHLDAIALIGPDHQRLNHVALQSGGDGARIIAVLIAGGLVLGLFRTGLLHVLRQDVHVAGIVVEPAVQRDFDVDHRNVVLLDRRIGRALSA